MIAAATTRRGELHHWRPGSFASRGLVRAIAAIEGRTTIAQRYPRLPRSVFRVDLEMAGEELPPRKMIFGKLTGNSSTRGVELYKIHGLLKLPASHEAEGALGQTSCGGSPL